MGSADPVGRGRLFSIHLLLEPSAWHRRLNSSGPQAEDWENICDTWSNPFWSLLRKIGLVQMDLKMYKVTPGSPTSIGQK